MMKTSAYVDALTEEYTTLLSGAGLATDGEGVDSQALVGRLVADGEWRWAGAEHLVNLAKENGVFMLRNALALAVAMGRDDGSLGH